MFYKNLIRFFLQYNFLTVQSSVVCATVSVYQFYSELYTVVTQLKRFRPQINDLYRTMKSKAI